MKNDDDKQTDYDLGRAVDELSREWTDFREGYDEIRVSKDSAGRTSDEGGEAPLCPYIQEQRARRVGQINGFEDWHRRGSDYVDDDRRAGHSREDIERDTDVVPLVDGWVWLIAGGAILIFILRVLSHT